MVDNDDIDMPQGFSGGDEPSSSMQKTDANFADVNQHVTGDDLKRIDRANRAMFWKMLSGAVLRRRSRAIMAVIASVVGTATLLTLIMVCLAVPAQMTEEMRDYGANLVVTSNNTGVTENGIQPDMVAHTTDMMTATGFDATYATYRYDTVRINGASYEMAGIEPKAVQAMNQFWEVDGGWPKNDNQVLLGSDVAERLSVKVGESITVGYDAVKNASSISSTTSTSTILDTEGTRMQVVGIVNTGGTEDSMLYSTIATLEKLTSVERGVDVIEYSSAATGADLKKLVDNINDMKSMNVTAQSVSKISAANESIIAMLTTLFWIISVVIVALTLVGVSTTMTSIVSQRRNEIGLRKALGASQSSIRHEFFAESALYGFCGGIIGVGIGYGVSWVLVSAVFSRTIGPNVWLIIMCVVLSTIIAVCASIMPVVKASQIDPAVVLREE